MYSSSESLREHESYEDINVLGMIGLVLFAIAILFALIQISILAGVGASL